MDTSISLKHNFHKIYTSLFISLSCLKTVKTHETAISVSPSSKMHKSFDSNMRLVLVYIKKVEPQ